MMSEKIRVLVIEDEPADAVLLLRALKQDGFDFDWVRVATEAEFLSQLLNAPEIILSDFDLPGFDAFRALELLQERGLDIPFILVTGRQGGDLAFDVMKSGLSDLVLKDELERLGLAVRTAIEQCRLRRQETAIHVAGEI
ncbi:response regulator [Nevskia soli]|uniref:response regulator n=1 Tax=Nevskia soli TaxID=418856 RepID=UPI0015D6868F|nr:response regulator [Nevskia soli]